MIDETAGRNPEAPEEAPVPTDDELVLATEEQRNEMLGGGEIQWTEEQLEVLGKDAPKQEPEQLGTEVVLGALDRAIEHEAVIQSKAEKSAAYQKLRKRAQAAEEREKEKERKLIELEAQNKAYKESLERLGPEEDYDLNDPEDLERYLAKKREDLGSTEDQPEPEYQTIPDEIARYEEERPRFADADGNIYDGKVDNPTGKPYFRIKNKEGKERVIFDRFALDEYDQNMYERFGPEVYKSMWGTPQRPGVMAIYRDKAPTEEIMQILSAPDPALATLQVYRNILGALAQVQQQRKSGQMPQQQQAIPQRKDIGPSPRGFGPSPITDSDVTTRQMKPHEVSDKHIKNMTDEERDAWLAD